MTLSLHHPHPLARALPLFLLAGVLLTALDTTAKFLIRDHSLFIAFAPADDPKIAMAILVENGGFGARAAAPIARQVLDYYLLGKVPNEPAKEGPDEEVASGPAARAKAAQ